MARSFSGWPWLARWALLWSRSICSCWRQPKTGLPRHRDFAQLPLAISEVARRDRVSIPDLSYALEKPQAGGFTKALLRGSVSGRYEDLRGFIHHLETADGFLFIEDLNVGRHSTKKGEAIAFQITLSTYIREGPGQR